MNSPDLPTTRGFTLIEVTVALFVVALGIGALLATLSSAAETQGYLRDRSFAGWVALNRIEEVRLSPTRPGTGTESGETEMGGLHWRWRQQVSNPGMAGMLRVDVSVSRGDAKEDAAPLATVYGFLGSAVAQPSGIEPDWSLVGAGTGSDGDKDDDSGTRQATQ